MRGKTLMRRDGHKGSMSVGLILFPFNVWSINVVINAKGGDCWIVGCH